MCLIALCALLLHTVLFHGNKSLLRNRVDTRTLHHHEDLNFSSTFFKSLASPIDHVHARNLTDQHHSPKTFDVVTLDEPLGFMFAKDGEVVSNVVISHAIPIPEEKVVVFLVEETSVNMDGTKTELLPPSLRCEFPDGSSSAMKLYKRQTRGEPTICIWACHLSSLFTHVTIAGVPEPNDIDRLKPPGYRVEEMLQSIKPVGTPGTLIPYNAVGSRNFTLSKTPMLRNEVAMCVKGLWNSSYVASRIEPFVQHYKNIGVGHFLVYIPESEDTDSYITKLQNLDVNITVIQQRLSTVLIGRDEPRGLFVEYQKWSTTDCVWRTRYRTKWVFIQVDLDEFLLNIQDLPTYMQQVPGDAAHVTWMRDVVKAPYKTPCISPGAEIATESPLQPGKAIVRPEMIDIMGVHMAMAMRGSRYVAEDSRIAHCREKIRKSSEGATGWQIWPDEFVRPRGALPVVRKQGRVA